MSRAKEDRVSELKSAYEAGQKKTFTKWANSFLRDRSIEIGDLYTDLQDGRNLLILLEKLSHETLVCSHMCCMHGTSCAGSPSPIRARCAFTRSRR